MQTRAFLALCERDLWVTVRHEPFPFVVQSLLQPTFFLLIFGRVLPEIGATPAAYGTLLLPGVIAFTVLLTALQNTGLPLVIEFSVTKEIEDRLLAPLTATGVAMQKMAIAALRGMIAGLMILPLAVLILPGGVNFGEINWAAFAGVMISGALVGSAIGLTLGTIVPPNRISFAFTVVLTPLLFAGCTFYPWSSLSVLPWFQVATLLDPLTYISEGMRASTSGSRHLGAGWIALGITAALVVFGSLGRRGFVRRAVN